MNKINKLSERITKKTHSRWNQHGTRNHEFLKCSSNAGGKLALKIIVKFDRIFNDEKESILGQPFIFGKDNRKKGEVSKSFGRIFTERIQEEF